MSVRIRICDDRPTGPTLQESCICGPRRRLVLLLHLSCSSSPTHAAYSFLLVLMGTRLPGYSGIQLFTAVLYSSSVSQSVSQPVSLVSHSPPPRRPCIAVDLPSRCRIATTILDAFRVSLAFRNHTNHLPIQSARNSRILWALGIVIIVTVKGKV
jgi:hypothetical protein